MSAGWRKTDCSPAVAITPADRRMAVVAFLVGAFPTWEVEDVEDVLMPAIDGSYRATYGHDAWTEWVA